MKLLNRKKSNAQNSRRNVAKQPSPPIGGVFSYHASRSKSEDGLGREELSMKTTNNRAWHYLPSLLAAFGIIFSLLYVLRLDTNPRIILADNTAGINLHSSNEYRLAGQRILANSWLNHNKLTINTGDVERHLKLQFPELRDAAVTLPLIGHRPVIELAMVQPVLVLASQNGNFAIAPNGKAISAVQPNNNTLKSLPVITDKSQLKVDIGTFVLPQSEVSFIETLVAQLKAQKVNIESMTLPAAPSELDVKPNGAAYYIKFNTLQDARTQAGTFLAVKQRLESDHITPAEYIDVRVEEKAFYK